MNKDPHLRRTARWRRAAEGLPLAALALAGCTSPSSRNAVAPPSPLPVIVVRANYNNYRKDHKCDGATPRPCSEPLYTSPYPHTPVYTNQVINALTSNGQAIAWPIEGDHVTVVCQVLGGQQNYYYGPDTKVIDIVAVPANSNHANQIALKAAQDQNPNWHVVLGQTGLIEKLTTNGIDEAVIYGYAAGAPIDNGQIFTNLPHCSAVENPAGAPPVRS